MDPDFDPSIKTLSHIVKTLVDKGPECKTYLARDTNLNYARLAKHIMWLEKKGLVESKIESSKINVVLTKDGKEFASIISDIG
ncbi:winged helix-turn-helix domain-containing protein [Candidatus Nitrosotenuis chungbukensis]|uniref:winged helix-turn-helix domain-containing protein n=1 Tax=Candidatus Nitrosotenuis chungbukensis TaxID=1353246 RepID=UPI001EE67440|nr:winged helix-turn-helix domain-containing protein [Candidatus Nitrosotenuis chungbukensis]